MNNFAKYSLLSACLSAACLTLLPGCSATPQLGSEECLGAADALWTAVTSKRPELLNSSATKIESLHAAGKLPDEAFQSLSGIVATARNGQWDNARIALKSFVKGQRPAPHPPAHGAS